MDYKPVRDISYYLLPTNASVIEEYVNVYFLGPLGSHVWVPFAVILFAFFVFFTYSFIVFHATNRDKYDARRKRLVIEKFSREEIMSSYSEETLNEILPKRRLRPFALKMNLEEVLRDIWRCHGANPRKLHAMILHQMQIQMLQNRKDTDCLDYETKSLPSSELFTGGYEGSGFQRSRRVSSASTSDSVESLLRSSLRGRGRQLPATPPLTRNSRPILQKAASVTVLGRRPSITNSVTFQIPPQRQNKPGSRGQGPPGIPSISGAMNGTFTSIGGQPLLPLSMLPRFEFYPSSYPNATGLSAQSSLDLDCDNDFVAEGGPSRSRHADDDKKSTNVFMMQRFYKR